MILYYTKEKELAEEYRLDRLKFDLIESQFINQKEALEALKGFLKLYMKNGNSPIINVYGQAGIGKTWLLKYFLETSVKDAGISYIALDAEGDRSAMNILLSLGRLISVKFDTKLNNFDTVLDTINRRVLDIIEAKDGAVLRPRKEKRNAYIVLSRVLEAIRRIYGDSLTFQDRIDLDSLENYHLIQLLPLALAEDLLRELSEDSRIVMIIDSLSKDLLHDELIPILLAALSSRMFIIVSTREKINWSKYSDSWSNPQHLISIQLQPFQSSDVDKYLENRLGISTEEFVENSIKITKGKAFYLTLYAEYLDQLSRSGVDIIDYAEKLISGEEKLDENRIIEHYVNQMSNRDKKIFYMASILDWFDPGELGSFFDKESGEDLVDNIISFSIVKPKLEMYDAWRLHNLFISALSSMGIDISEEEINAFTDFLLGKYKKRNDFYALMQYLNVLGNISREKLLNVLEETINNLYFTGQLRENVIMLNWILDKIDLDTTMKHFYAKLLESISLDKEAVGIYRALIDNPESTDFDKIRARTQLAKILFAKGHFSDALSIIRVNLEKIERIPLNQETLLEKMHCYLLLSKTLYVNGRINEALDYIKSLESNYNEFISIDKTILEEPFGRDLQRIYLNSLFLKANIFLKEEKNQALSILKKIADESKGYLNRYPRDIIVLRTYSNTLDLVVDIITDSELFTREFPWLSEHLKFLNYLISVQTPKIIDPIVLKNLFTIYEKIGDIYASSENYNQAFIYYNEIYELSKSMSFSPSTLDLMIHKIKVAPKIARILLRSNNKKETADLLIEARDNIEMLIKMGISAKDIWISYFNILKMLGKVYMRLSNYERAIGILSKAIGVANSIIAQYGAEHVNMKDYLDTFKDLFRSHLESAQYQSAINILNKMRELFKTVLSDSGEWKKPETVLILLKITRILKQHLTSPEEFLNKATLVLKDILIHIFSKIKESSELPLDAVDYFGSLSWTTISLAKIWYSLSMFNDLYELLGTAIETIELISDKISEDERPMIKSYEFNLRLRRAIARFFSELGIEQVEEDLNACRGILAELEGKFDPIELAYMKCSLILFDSRIKNSLKQFDQSIMDLRDFISIVSSLPPKKLNVIRAKELFDRAYKALKDIKILTRGKLDDPLKENIMEIENELRTLRKRFIGK